MLPESDNDSHTPLLIHLTPSWMSNKERRELRNPDTLHDRRRELQRAKKRGDLEPSPTETPGTGSARPAEPENPPSGKGKRPAEPADPPLGKGKGKRPAEPADPPNGKGKKGELQKGKRATMRRASPRKALRKAPPRRASPRASTTARVRARSEAVRVREGFFLRRNPHYALFLSSFFTTPKECINF